MKSVLFGLLLVSSSVFATSIDMTPVVATVQGCQQGIGQVAHLAVGRLMLKMQDNKVKVTQLSETASDYLIGLSKSLASAEVNTEHRTVVCMEKALPSLSDLSISNYNENKSAFEGQPRLLMTAQSCSLSFSVLPVDEYSVERAKKLRDQLVILALNTLKK